MDADLMGASRDERAAKQRSVLRCWTHRLVTRLAVLTIVANDDATAIGGVASKRQHDAASRWIGLAADDREVLFDDASRRGVPLQSGVCGRCERDDDDARSTLVESSENAWLSVGTVADAPQYGVQQRA